MIAMQLGSGIENRSGKGARPDGDAGYAETAICLPLTPVVEAPAFRDGLAVNRGSDPIRNGRSNLSRPGA